MKRKLMFLMIFLFVSSVFSAEIYSGKVYSFTIVNEQGKLSLSNLYLVLDGTYSEPFIKPSGDLTLKLISFKDEDLFEQKFSFSPMIIEGVGLDESFMSVSFVIPFNEEAEKFVVLNSDNEELLSFDVSFLSDYCGNYSCSEKEDELSCPQDCRQIVFEEPGRDEPKVIDVDFALILVPLILVILVIVFWRMHFK